MQDTGDTSGLKSFLGINESAGGDTSQLKAFLGVPQQQVEPEQKPLMQRAGDRLSNLWEMAKADLGAFNGGVDYMAHGAFQPLIESDSNTNEIAKQVSRQRAIDREAQYEYAKQLDPGGARFARGVGMIGGAIPAIAATYGVGAVAGPGLLGRTLLNNGVQGVVSGALTGGQGYVPGNDLVQRGINAGIGGFLGLTFPAAFYAANKLSDALNPTMQQVAKSILGPANVEKTLATKAAGERIGITLRPDEAAGNPKIASSVGKLGKLDETSNALNDSMQSRFAKEQVVVSDFLDSVSPQNKAPIGLSHQEKLRASALSAIDEAQSTLNSKVNPFYEKAKHELVPQAEIKKLMSQDGNIDAAIKTVLKDKTYKAELGRTSLPGEGYPNNSIKVLDLAKKQIDARITAAQGNAMVKGDANLVRILEDSKKRLVAATDSFSENYRLARQTYSENVGPVNELRQSMVGKIADAKDLSVGKLHKDIFSRSPEEIAKLRKTLRPLNPEAWDANVRNYIEDRLANTSGAGSDFYTKLLKNNNQFNKLVIATADTPGATQFLNDARLSLKDVYNPITVKTAHGYSNTGVDSPRLGSDKLDWRTQLSNFFGGRADKKGTAFVISPDWEKQIALAKAIPDPGKRHMALAHLMAQMSNTQSIDALNNREQ